MKAVYIPLGAAGHVLSSLPMIRSLVNKGVEVRYFSPIRYKEQVEATGARHIELPVIAGKNSVDGGDDFVAGLPLVFLGEALGVIDIIMAEIEADRPDVIIVDEIALAGRLAAWKTGIPMVMMFTSYAANEHFSISRFWPVYTDEHPARAAAKELALQIQAEYGGPLIDIYEIFEGIGEFNIVTQPKSFHPAGATFGDNFFFAGAQIAPRSNDGTWQAPDNGKPLLYTSLGSLFNNWPEFYTMLFEAVKDLDINILCSLGNTLKPEDLGEIPANVTTMAFTPQLEVLAKTDYFITHAGTGSAMEALYFGVPCLCVPQMDEQVMTAGQMVKLGLASASLTRPEVTVDSLREGILALINDPKYKANAQAMADEMHQFGGCDRAADAVIEFTKARM
ncbi:MAG: hypothetical protein J6R94_03895 [Agathobacter sp.]|nr:hypothetical protein [Agathobacter sp.]